MKFRFTLALLALSLLLACNNDDGVSKHCEFVTVSSSEAFANAPADDHMINDLTIRDGCLEINFSAGGCSGETWVFQLIDSERVDFMVTQDVPSSGRLAQRRLRLSLEDNEDCEALITREATFDISNLQVAGENRVELNFDNTLQTVLYEY